MSEEKYSIQLRCVFCASSDFEIPHKNYKPRHGEFIKCDNCGRENDYSSLLEVAKEEAIEITKKNLADIFKKTFKGNKYIKFK